MENNLKSLPEQEKSFEKDPLLEQMDKIDINSFFKNTIISSDLPIPRRDVSPLSLFNRHDGITESNRTAEDLFKYQMVKAARRLYAYEKPVELTIKILLDRDKDEQIRDNTMSVTSDVSITLSKLPKSGVRNSGYLSYKGNLTLEDPRISQIGMFGDSERNGKN